MKFARHALIPLLFGSLILAFWFIYSEKLSEQNIAVNLDQSNPESTVRLFLLAVENNNLIAAAKLVDAEKLNQGRYAKDIKLYFQTLTKINAKQLHLKTRENRVSVYSDEYNMDYDLEKSEAGQWLIVSIHP